MLIPRCQHKIRARDGSLVRCPQQAHWVIRLADGSNHSLICKPHGLFCTGVDLVPVRLVLEQFARVSAEPEWPARFDNWYRPLPKPEPPPRLCIVCGAESAVWRCPGCKYWLARQPVIGRRAVNQITRQLSGSGTTLRQLQAEPGRLRGLRDVGPKSVQWLLEVELPTQERV